MALIRCDFHSEVLGMGTSLTVLLPERGDSQIGMAGSATAGDPPVLYLLHGLSDDDTIWTRRTSIERYVAPLGLAVVMPQVGRSSTPTRPTATGTGRSSAPNCPRSASRSSGCRSDGRTRSSRGCPWAGTGR